MHFERIHIELTNKCNFDCAFCPDSHMTRPRGSMDLETFKIAILQIAESKLTDTIMLHLMGEPLLYPEIDKTIEYVHEKGMKVCLTTNGAAFDSDLLGRLIRSGVDEVIFSVQTPTERSFKTRGAAISFDKYRETVINAISTILKAKTGIVVTLSFLTTPFKTQLAPDFKTDIISSKASLKDDCSPWVEQIISETSIGSADNLSFSLKKLSLMKWNRMPISENFFIETRVLGDWVRSGKIYPADFGCCEGLTKHFGILWNGDFVFCCVDFDGKTSFGNIRDISIKDALAADDVQKTIDDFRRLRVRHPFCKVCLGDRSRFRTFARQVGSILYFKFLRKYWDANER